MYTQQRTARKLCVCEGKGVVHIYVHTMYKHVYVMTIFIIGGSGGGGGGGGGGERKEERERCKPYLDFWLIR